MRTIIQLGGGDVNRPRLDGITPVLIAAERNVSVDLMRLLLDSGGDLRRLRQVRHREQLNTHGKKLVLTIFILKKNMYIGWCIGPYYCE